MFMSGMFNLDRWDSDADYLIIDDIEWKFLPNKKQLLGGQKQFTMSDKYRSKMDVKWSKPCIICCNPEEYIEMQQDKMVKWINDRCVFIHLNNQKLY